MIYSRLIVSILFLFSFFAYYLYRFNTVMIEMGSDRDDGTYNPLMVPQHFHRSSNFFNCKTHHGYCGCTASSDRNMIGAQICSVHDRMLHVSSSTIATRQHIPNIIPPLPKTGCEELTNSIDMIFCDGEVQRIIAIAACVGAGLVTVPALFLIAWTLARWVRVVRPRKETILIGKEAKKKAVGLTGSGSRERGGRDIQELVRGKEAYIDEKIAGGARAKKARARTEEREVWYGGVRMTMPWGRGENWNQAVGWHCRVTVKED
jgi:hypothetical protein